MADSPIRVLEPPPRVRLPLEAMVPVVAVGDEVEAGTVVTETPPGAPWYQCSHAPLSGTVTAIVDPRSSNGHPATQRALVIEGNPPAAPPCQHRDPKSLDPEQIRRAARDAGLVGMGGAMFPTHVKLSPEHAIDYVLVNGCESEPYLTCDHRVLVEHRDEVECGMQLVMQAVGATRGEIITKEDDYLDGYERRLIHKVLGRRVPPRGKPSDVGVVVVNVQTARALHRAVCQRRPLVDRVITVDGDAIRRPGNYVVPIGTEVGHILEVCGVDWEHTAAVIAGGPMMGRAAGPESIVTGGTGAVLALGDREISWTGSDPCIQCGQCQEVCPLALPVCWLVRRPNRTVFQCIECGICQFACPAGRALLPGLRKAKQTLTDSIRGI